MIVEGEGGEEGSYSLFGYLFKHGNDDTREIK